MFTIGDSQIVLFSVVPREGEDGFKLEIGFQSDKSSRSLGVSKRLGWRGDDVMTEIVTADEI